MENVPLHPHLRQTILAVIAWASDADIDFQLTTNSIVINLSPVIDYAENHMANLTIKYRNTDESS